MDNDWARAAVLAGILVPFLAKGQQSCREGIRIEGTVTDVTGAVIPRAAIDSGKGQKATTDSMGHYVLACVPAGSVTLTVHADGFSPDTTTARGEAGERAQVDLQLAVLMADVGELRHER